MDTPIDFPMCDLLNGHGSPGNVHETEREIEGNGFGAPSYHINHSILFSQSFL
jgi:hypothetical protein